MLILWIFIFVVGLVRSQNPEIDLLVTTVSNSLSKAFNDLKLFMNADNLAAQIKTTPQVVTNDVAINILTQSKTKTEALVSQTSSVVDNLQKKITTSFVEYSSTTPKSYNIDCPIPNYIFYFKAKAIRNGTYEINNCTLQKLPFTNDSLLGNIMTSRQNSTIHVPTNVFDSSNEIQIVANYTQNVDQVFALSERNPQIKWQFFCSNTGFYKIFPGIRWNIQFEDMEKDNTKVDFFDCRSEQWFLESTAYPKKMMIMVDKSGSMKGRRRIIANHTIYEILNTITENDYFNLILFTKEIQFADNKTTDILMQATEKNKKFIMDQLDINFIPDGIAEYDYGLKASFKVLQNEKNKENGSTIYNYLLMIITDGSPMNYQEIIDEFNKNIQARIFTYLIGQASTEREVVKQMACKNKGYAVEIATLADVKENVQKHLNVVARPNAIMQNAFFIWTGVHQYQMRPSRDQVVFSTSIQTPQQLGLSTTMYFLTNISQSTSLSGITMAMQSNVSITPPAPPTPKIEIVKYEPIEMFVTVSKAAYDATNATSQKNIGNLLGAAGVDVPISDFIKTAPFWMMGVNAYLFGVTQNGFVIFHPRFRPQYKKFVKYFYRNVDISEVEIKFDQIITEINPNQTISSSLRDRIMTVKPTDLPAFVENRSTFDIVDDFKTAFKSDRNYYIAGINNTPYKFGFAVPISQVVSQYSSPTDFVNMDLSVFSDAFKNNASSCNASTVNANEGGIALKPYEFCNLNRRIAALMLQNPLCALREVLLNQTLRTLCLTIPDGKNTSDQTLDLYIRSLYNEADDTKSLPTDWSGKSSTASSLSVQQIFSMHHFGLIRYYNYKSLSYEQFIQDHNEAIQDPLYQETVLTAQALQNPGILVVRPLPNDVVKKNTNESLLVFTVSTPIVTASEYKGILGVQVDQQFYLKYLMTPSCSSGQCISCNNTSLLDCYVVTGSGMVVLNNQNVGNTGELLKEIDCKLMESLVDSGIFRGQSLYDFQALCTIIPKTDSFASTLTDPFMKLFRFSIWFIYELLIIIQNFSLSSFLWTFTSQEDTDQFRELPRASLDGDNMQVSIFSTESPYKPLVNSSPNIKSAGESVSPTPKSKRQHEFFVKNTLEEKISYCKKNNNSAENDFSVCIQKAVTDICKLDKSHDGKQSDQHVDKLTSLNTISHCVTVCLILQSDYPSIWQEQDDCRQPNYMCRTVSQTFTSLFRSSTLAHSVSEPKDLNQPDVAPPTYFQYQQQIMTNEEQIYNPVLKGPTPMTVINGSMCGNDCPAKTWYATAIPNTNLILIMVYKQNAACSCDCKSSFGAKIEITRNTSNPIENPAVQLANYYSQFVAFTKVENSTDCSDDASHVTMPPRWMIIIPGAFLLLMVY